MRRMGLFVAAALTLAGCGGGGYELLGPQGGGNGLPAVTMRANEGVVVPPGRGAQKALALRTFTPTADGWQEAPGAQCTVVAGDYFTATVVTPVRLLLPDLGPDAPQIRADCTLGTAKGAAAVAPAFSWPAEGHASPPARVAYSGGWWYGFQKSGPLSYPDLSVGLR